MEIVATVAVVCVLFFKGRLSFFLTLLRCNKREVSQSNQVHLGEEEKKRERLGRGSCARGNSISCVRERESLAFVELRVLHSFCVIFSADL